MIKAIFTFASRKDLKKLMEIVEAASDLPWIDDEGEFDEGVNIRVIEEDE